MSRLPDAKRRRDAASMALRSAMDAGLFNGESRESKKRRVDAAYEQLEAEEDGVRHWQAAEAWDYAVTHTRQPDNVKACAIFAAGLAQAHAIDRAAEVIASALRGGKRV